MSDDELEELRRRKLSALQRQMSDEQKSEQMQKQVDAQKENLLRSILSQEARQRLTNLKMVKPEFTEQLEMQLIQLAQQRKIPVPLADAQLRQILVQLQSSKHEPTIRRK